MEMKLGNIELKTAQNQTTRISLLIWGMSGCGKTTLAATAPGKKLWLSFDADATACLGDRDDIVVADLFLEHVNTTTKFTDDTVLGIEKLLIANPEIETIVLDSITSFGEMALKHASIMANSSTLEKPTQQAYGMKNTYTLQAIQTLLRITARHKKHLIVIAHEGAPDKDEQTGKMVIRLMLGGQLQALVPLKFSEVWHIRDDGIGTDRVIGVRPTKLHSPMKSRMFDITSDADFVWKFNPITQIGDGITNWYNKWIENRGNKVSLPK